MADFNENQNGVFGGVQFNDTNKGGENTSYFEGSFESNDWKNTQESNNGVFGNNTVDNNSWNNTQNTTNNSGNDSTNFKPIGKEKAITEQGLWSKIKAFLFQEIDLTAPIRVELTPYQQKVEDEINEFLHQEITFKGIANFFKGKK